jgi:alkane 1-monooxygenase
MENKQMTLLRNAMPFWISLTTLPVLAFSMYMGGLWYLACFLYTWILMGSLDIFIGLNAKDKDVNTPHADLFWYRLITIIWAPIQFAVIFGAIYFVTQVELRTGEFIGLAISVGILSGSFGIVYAHELMHQRPAFERHLGDILMCMALYGHFRSEHLLVHHKYVATPKDTVTARYNEGFHRFIKRVIVDGVPSAWNAEREMLARRGLSVWHHRNPFWKYAALEIGFLALAIWIGGWAGFIFMLLQSTMAILSLELVNYVEHYGLTREHLGDGKYEHCKPRHSWNSAHMLTNFILINLQRHSDHHYKPDRRYPLLQNYGPEDAPQLPFGYPIMTLSALCPPLWRHRMNPRVRAWRKQFYPHITEWQDYNQATNPMPR